MLRHESKLFAWRNVYLSYHVLEGCFPSIEVFRGAVKFLYFVSNELPSGEKLNETFHAVSRVRIEGRCSRIELFRKAGLLFLDWEATGGEVLCFKVTVMMIFIRF